MEFTYIFYTVFMFLMIWLSIPARYKNKDSDLLEEDYWDVRKIILLIGYSLIIGCRYNVGIDYKVYLNWYNELYNTGQFQENSEFGYVVLNRILVFFDAHFSILFIIISFIQMFFLLKAMEKMSFVLPWYFFFFFTSLLMFSSMNIMRQTIAYFIFFYTIILFQDKKYWQIVLLLIFGFSFHKSILFFIWVYPLLKSDWFKNKYIQCGILIIVTFITTQLISNLMNFVSPIVNLLGYEYYLQNLDQMAEITKENSKGAGFGIYLLFIIDIIVVLFSDKLKERFKGYNFIGFYNLYFLGAILERVFIENFLLARTNDYLINFRVLMLSFLCIYLMENRINRFYHIVFSIIVIGMLAYFYRGIDNSAAMCSPFRFFFDL